MDALVVRSHWKVLVAILVFCAMFWLAVIYGGLMAVRAFAPTLAESLSFRAHASDRMPRLERLEESHR